VVERDGIALMPRCAAGRLEFAPVERWEDLRPGRYGVLEPASEALVLGPADLVVVPGLAFDLAGHRLGRGAGYYDRTFAGRSRRPRLVGFAHAFQLLDAVPHGAGDCAVDAVVTEAGIHCCSETTR
jgi:5-formyltetrahydrofolate cyclo-ligase